MQEPALTKGKPCVAVRIPRRQFLWQVSGSKGTVAIALFAKDVVLVLVADDAHVTDVFGKVLEITGGNFRKIGSQIGTRAGKIVF